MPINSNSRVGTENGSWPCWMAMTARRSSQDVGQRNPRLFRGFRSGHFGSQERPRGQGTWRENCDEPSLREKTLTNRKAAPSNRA